MKIGKFGNALELGMHKIEYFLDGFMIKVDGIFVQL